MPAITNEQWAQGQRTFIPIGGGVVQQGRPTTNAPSVIQKTDQQKPELIVQTSTSPSLAEICGRFKFFNDNDGGFLGLTENQSALVVAILAGSLGAYLSTR